MLKYKEKRSLRPQGPTVGMELLRRGKRAPSPPATGSGGALWEHCKLPSFEFEIWKNLICQNSLKKCLNA